MKLQDIKTPEEMLDYIIEHVKTYRCIYKKDTKMYSFYTDLLNDLDILKEEFERRYQVEMNFKIIGVKRDNDHVTGLVTNNGFVMQITDVDGTPLAFNKEFLERLKIERRPE